jgi:inorganic pyrophosphatase
MDENEDSIDLVAYGNSETQLSLEKNRMKRVFNSFDVMNTGYLDNELISQLCDYLNCPIQRNEINYNSLLSKNEINFDDFFDWWNKHCEIFESNKIISTLKLEFDVPYHQQQLIVEYEGEKYTTNYKIKYFVKNIETNKIKQISPWHDIPLFIKDYVLTTEKPEVNKYNFICEIPKWTRAKFEISTKESYNPIKQDIKNGLPRFYKHGDMMWNYGAFPQTWESTDVLFFDKYKGDSDPLDVIEIGMKQIKCGEVYNVKVLGALGMIDDGEMDWKVICISCNDPCAQFINDITDIPSHLPGCLEAIREWLRTYKICTGGAENKFAFDGEYQNKQYAIDLINKSYRMWANLKKIQEKHCL